MYSIPLVTVVSYQAVSLIFFFFQAEDGIRDLTVTGVQTCALPIYRHRKTVIELAVVAARRDLRGSPAQHSAAAAAVVLVRADAGPSRRARRLEIGRASCRERG